MHLFTDDEKILSKLSEKGNPLERLDAVMNWNIFLPLLSELFSRKDKVISRGGRPHLDYLMMFKVLLLQRLHNLSDDAMEYQLLDRLSFCRFVGCHEDTVPERRELSWMFSINLVQVLMSIKPILSSVSYMDHSPQLVQSVRWLRLIQRLKAYVLATIFSVNFMWKLLVWKAQVFIGDLSGIL
ncbi:transposase, partial [Streptococcus suis]|uniref:transposase n=4 Tax=Streptococcus suis TaxID=1307 RepID=UPI0021BC2CB8